MSRVRDPYARFCERDKYGMIFYIYYYSIFTLLDFAKYYYLCKAKKQRTFVMSMCFNL